MTQSLKPVLPRRTLLAAAIALIGFVGGACAHAGDYANLVALAVVDRDTGQPLQVWRHDGRLFVAGQPGARYSLRVTNHSGGRVLVVMSVDGVNILTGETAGYDQRGYVFDPYESYDISGWRKSDTEVAAFAFAALPQSYAARTGRPDNVGVIGIAVFKEKPVYRPPPAPLAEAPAPSPPFTAHRAAGFAAPPPVNVPAPAAPAMAPAPPPAGDAESVVVTAQRRDDRIGTAHGEREWSVSYTVSFQRATRYPQYVGKIEYDTYDNLVAAGVIPDYQASGPSPRPFPSNHDGQGYVPDPPEDP